MVATLTPTPSFLARYFRGIGLDPSGDLSVPYLDQTGSLRAGPFAQYAPAAMESLDRLVTGIGRIADSTPLERKRGQGLRFLVFDDFNTSQDDEHTTRIDFGATEQRLLPSGANPPLWDGRSWFIAIKWFDGGPHVLNVTMITRAFDGDSLFSISRSATRVFSPAYRRCDDNVTTEIGAEARAFWSRVAAGDPQVSYMNGLVLGAALFTRIFRADPGYLRSDVEIRRQPGDMDDTVDRPPPDYKLVWDREGRPRFRQGVREVPQRSVDVGKSFSFEMRRRGRRGPQGTQLTLHVTPSEVCLTHTRRPREPVPDEIRRITRVARRKIEADLRDLDGLPPAERSRLLSRRG